LLPAATTNETDAAGGVVQPSVQEHRVDHEIHDVARGADGAEAEELTAHRLAVSSSAAPDSSAERLVRARRT
jgi:hypothetical protein